MSRIAPLFWPPWWHILWWIEWHGRDPGDVFDPQWLKAMGLPPRETWECVARTEPK